MINQISLESPIAETESISEFAAVVVESETRLSRESIAPSSVLPVESLDQISSFAVASGTSVGDSSVGDSLSRFSSEGSLNPDNNPDNDIALAVDLLLAEFGEIDWRL